MPQVFAGLEARFITPLLYPLSYGGVSRGNTETVFPTIEAGFGLFAVAEPAALSTELRGRLA
jgi:hypothetical protein